VERALKRAGFLIAAAWVLPAGATTADEISNLLRNSPFASPTAEKVAVPVPTQLELRGVVVEGDVAWFTFYDGAAQKWMTVREGGEEGALAVKSYDRTQDLVVLNYAGRTMSLALNPERHQTQGAAGVAALASAAAAKPVVPQPIIVPSLPAAEARRLELVAAAIRERDKKAKLGAPASPRAGS